MTWWQRNKVALIALVPLTVAAASASSYRLNDLWLPSQPTPPTAVAGTSAHYHSEFRRGGVHTRDVDVTVVGIRDAASLNGLRAASGATLKVVTLDLAADPEAFLDGCTAQLTGPDQVVRGTNGGKVDATTGAPRFDPAGCVPTDAPGPYVDSFTGQVVPSPAPRPGRWRAEIAFAVPQNAQVTQLRLYWDTPGYLVFTLPQ